MTSPTLIWPSFPVPVLPLAGLFAVSSGVLAARAEYIHDFRDETGEHRLRGHWRHLHAAQPATESQADLCTKASRR